MKLYFALPLFLTFLIFISDAREAGNEDYEKASDDSAHLNVNKTNDDGRDEIPAPAAKLKPAVSQSKNKDKDNGNLPGDDATANLPNSEAKSPLEGRKPLQPSGRRGDSTNVKTNDVKPAPIVEQADENEAVPEEKSAASSSLDKVGNGKSSSIVRPSDAKGKITEDGKPADESETVPEEKSAASSSLDKVGNGKSASGVRPSDAKGKITEDGKSAAIVSSSDASGNVAKIDAQSRKSAAVAGASNENETVSGDGKFGSPFRSSNTKQTDVGDKADADPSSNEMTNQQSPSGAADPLKLKDTALGGNPFAAKTASNTSDTKSQNAATSVVNVYVATSPAKANKQSTVSMLPEKGQPTTTYASTSKPLVAATTPASQLVNITTEKAMEDLQKNPNGGKTGDNGPFSPENTLQQPKPLTPLDSGDGEKEPMPANTNGLRAPSVGSDDGDDDDPEPSKDQNENKLPSEVATNNKKPIAKPDATLPRMSYNDEPENSHFLAYLFTVGILCVAAYLMAHNRHKLMGILFEGRQGKRRHRSSSGSGKGVKYKRLQGDDDAENGAHFSSQDGGRVVYLAGYYKS